MLINHMSHVYHGSSLDYFWPPVESMTKPRGINVYLSDVCVNDHHLTNVSIQGFGVFSTLTVPLEGRDTKRVVSQSSTKGTPLTTLSFL